VSGTNAIVLDSNAVIELLNDEANSLALEEQFPDAAVCISVITQIEVLGFPNITPGEEKQIVDFLSDITVVNIDNAIIAGAVAIRRNKNKKIKLPDAIVAATALALGATLITRDDDLLKLQLDSFSASTMGPL
jgi:predicted nucleic acid-binding protein